MSSLYEIEPPFPVKLATHSQVADERKTHFYKQRQCGAWPDPLESLTAFPIFPFWWWVGPFRLKFGRKRESIELL
jgi:hypothetical protein